MFRSTAPRLAMAVMVVAAVVPLALPHSAIAAPKEPVRATDFAFVSNSLDVEVGDTVAWVLDPNATNPHQVTLDANGNGDFDDDDNGEFDLSSPDLAPGSRLNHTFDQPGTYQFFCKHHLIQYGMAGTIQVSEPATTTTTEAPTTTTTAPPPTTTTTTAPAPPPPPPTTTTTRPRSTTTTTKPDTTPTTQPPASASTDDPATTDTTARATTTTGKATTTTGKKKPTTTTTKPPETTTTSAVSAEWIPTPDLVPDGSPTTTTTAPELQAAADHRPKSGKGGGGGFPIVGAGALGVLLLGAVGWAWYHRSSRYLPA